MDVTGLTFCYSAPYSFDSLGYQLKSKDNDLRFLFHLDEPCGIITFIVCLFAVLLIASAMISLQTVRKNRQIFQELQENADRKLPRKESVLDIRPAYNCIHKHLRQTDVFQEKAKRTLWKERLEIELMNSRISCINKLLKPELMVNSSLFTGARISLAKIKIPKSILPERKSRDSLTKNTHRFK